MRIVKRSFLCILLLICLFILNGCTAKTYKDTQDIEKIFMEKEAAFVKFAAATEKIDGIYDNSGYIHKEDSSVACNEILILKTLGNLHIHSKCAFSGEEYEILAEEVDALFSQVDVAAIVFADGQLRFELNDACYKYSWYPTIAYALCADLTIEDMMWRRFESDGIRELKDRWYAYIYAY